MIIAATRAPSELTEGWLSIPVTRKATIDSGIRRLHDLCADSQDADTTSPAGEASPVWLAVTSGYVFQLMAECGIDIPVCFYLACVGQGTARKAPRTPDLVGPSPATAASFAAALVQCNPGSVIFPASALASSVVTDTLAQWHIPTERINIYTSHADPPGVERMAESDPDVVVVTSSSAARALVTHWPGELPALVAIGQPTARTLTQLDAAPAGVAAHPDRRGIEDCLERIAL